MSDGKVRAYCGLPDEEGDHLTVRQISGRKGLKAMISAMRQQLVAGDIIFIEESGGDPMETGTTTFQDIIKLLDLEQYCTKHTLDYNILKNHVVSFSTDPDNRNFSFLDLYKAKAGDARKIGNLPDNHPFEIMAGLADKILHPLPGDWNMGTPGENTGPGDEFFAGLGLGDQADVV